MASLACYVQPKWFWNDPRRLGGASRMKTVLHAAPVIQSLAGQPIHNLAGRRFIPLVGPDADATLPFAVALEVLEPDQQSQLPESTSSSVDTAQHGLGTYLLQYILEGRGQVDFTGVHHQAEVVQAGDTLLTPTNVARCTAASTSSLDSSDVPSTSGLVRLVMLLPQEVFDQDNEAARLSSHQSVVSTWREWTSSPVVGHLTQEELETILSKRHRIPDTEPLPLFPFPTSSTPPAHTAPPALPALPSTMLPSLHQLRHHLVQHSQYFMQHMVTSLSDLQRHLLVGSRGAPLVIKRALDDIDTFQLPNQTNRLALVFDPVQHPVPFTFGVEIFEAGHRTKPHVHPHAHELFFILAGEGTGFCDGRFFSVSAGHLVLFPPECVHGIDVSSHSKMYCLEFMLPNDMFAEFVKEGRLTQLEDDDLCTLNAISC